MINLKNWGLIRIFRLVIAVVIAIQAIVLQQYFWLAFSAFLLWQVWTNKGCATAYQNTPKPDFSEIENTEYEEIK